MFSMVTSLAVILANLTLPPPPVPVELPLYRVFEVPAPIMVKDLLIVALSPVKVAVSINIVSPALAAVMAACNVNLGVAGEVPLLALLPIAVQ